MSNTDALKKTEANLVPPGFEIDHVFDIQIGDYHGTAEVDGFDPVSREAVEIYQTDTRSPKSGQHRENEVRHTSGTKIPPENPQAKSEECTVQSKKGDER
jgi:hypothetical protein